MKNETVITAIEVITTYGLNVIGGIAILIIGWIVANRVAGMARKVLTKSPRIDQTLSGFLSSLTKYLILAFVGIAVLNQFGVETTSLIAVFGAAGLTVGLALQGTLSNIAAGVMLLIFRPIRVGQYVEVAGQSGTVVELSLFTTELATSNNLQVIIPNGAVWGASVVNYSHHTTRRADLTLSISYGDDIGKAIAMVRGLVEADDRPLADHEPLIVVGELADSSVNLFLRVWVDAGDNAAFKYDMMKRFKEACDEAGIVIPFPQHEVHMAAAAAE